MKITILLLLFILILSRVSAQHPEEENAAPKEHTSLEKKFKVPENNQSIKMLGNNITDISLNAPLYYIPRNEDAAILSYTAKDSGNYLIIWKVNGIDTNSFYPNRPETIAIDSSGTADLSINGKNIGVPKDFLLKQFTKSEDSLNDKISFLPIPIDCSEVEHLNQNDTLSVIIYLKGFPKMNFISKINVMPLNVFRTCEIYGAEIILIKINDNR